MPQLTPYKTLSSLPLVYLFALSAGAQTVEPIDPDLIDAYEGTSAVETFSSANGKTAVSYEHSATRINANLSNGTGSGGDASGDTYEGITALIGADISGNKGYNILKGDDAPNSLYGLGSSKNSFEGKGGPDTIVGSPSGWNWALYSRSDEAVSINLETNQNFGGHAQGDILLNIDAVRGSDFSDYLRGSGRSEYLEGERGQNTFDPRGGNDTSIGDRDNDTYFYTSGHDTIKESTNAASTGDTVIFDAKYNPQYTYVTDNTITFADYNGSIEFNDITLIENFSFSGYRTLTLEELKNVIGIAPDPFYENSTIATDKATHYDAQNDGNETVSYSFSDAPINVSLNKGIGTKNDSAGDTYSGILNVIGADSKHGDGYNIITGNDLPNRLYGLGSSRNIFRGLGGPDTMVGSPSGWNRVKYDHSPEGVTINLRTNINLGGDAQGDLLYDIDAVEGSDYDDSFTGTEKAELFEGEKGIDKAHYSGNFSDYNITVDGNQTAIKDMRSPSIEGSDILISIEEIHFEDGILRGGDFQSHTNFSLTLQASNAGGKSDPSDPVYVQNPDPSKDITISFQAPDRLVSGACVHNYPVWEYHINISALDGNDNAIETNTISFSVDDVDLICEDNLDDFDEQCDVYRQQCHRTFDGMSEPLLETETNNQTFSIEP